MANIINKKPEFEDGVSIPGKMADDGQKAAVLESIKDEDWSGLPKIGYCCFNSFTFKPDATKFVQ